MRPFRLFVILFLLSRFAALAQGAPPYKRVIILKIDGLNADLLYNTMAETDPASGKSKLPWLEHIFAEQGVIFENFYTRGISLSAPSWSMLDTGRHTIIRGNVEFDRYTGQVYDYLNVFPFYIGYARKTAVDMPGVEVLDRAGIPLLIDRFPYDQVLQSFQLFQRGVSWTTLQDALLHSFSRKALISAVESSQRISLSSSLYRQIENQVIQGIHGSALLYLDFYSGDADHEGHATSDPAALLQVMQQIDSFAGRVWTAIQDSPLASQTLLAIVSDHGMNNVPGVISQTFSLPDFFASRIGGGHHVVTDREQLSDFKLRGINPLVHRVITPSPFSYYLAGESSDYPTVWLDLDGNERASVHLRNNDLNKLHILLIQMARADLAPSLRKAAAECFSQLVDAHRAAWSRTSEDLQQELDALTQAIAARRQTLARMSDKYSERDRSQGKDKQERRLRRELQEWRGEQSAYGSYLSHLRALLSFEPDPARRYTGKISALIPPLALGDNNSFADIQHYGIGLSPDGLVLTPAGKLDQERSFQYVDYFALLSGQLARNNPQPQLSPHPIDFTAIRLADADNRHAYLLYGDSHHQLLILEDPRNRISVQPVRMISGTSWQVQPWQPNLPLHLWEDPQLEIPAGTDRAAWLSAWHSEQEWFTAIHNTRYSNGVVGVTEELSPVAPNVPGPPGISPVLLRYEKRRRELVQADFHVFAADHWNFNVRFPNPGGNHGSFLRISTHSVWMMAGAGLPAKRVEQPYDSLNFASTVLNLLSRVPPMPDRVVHLR